MPIASICKNCRYSLLEPPDPKQLTAPRTRRCTWGPPHMTIFPVFEPRGQVVGSQEFSRHTVVSDTDSCGQFAPALVVNQNELPKPIV